MAAAARDVTLDFVLALLAATVAVTCATSGELGPRRRAPPRPPSTLVGSAARNTPSAPAPLAGEAAPPAPPLPPASSSAGEVAPAAAPPPWRGTFEALTSRTRAESVHVVWLGDSHTAADFWTQAVRAELQARYGNGGPGFLRLGISPYRHGRAKVVTAGRWRRVPSAPARVTPTDDGVFALGGMRAEPISADARVTVELYTTAVRGEARWDLSFRFPKPNASFALELDAVYARYGFRAADPMRVERDDADA